MKKIVILTALIISLGNSLIAANQIPHIPTQKTQSDAKKTRQRLFITHRLLALKKQLEASHKNAATPVYPPKKKAKAPAKKKKLFGPIRFPLKDKANFNIGSYRKLGKKSRKPKGK